MTTVTPDAGHHLHLPAGAKVGDGRGLTATGAVVLALVMGVVGALIDEATGAALRTAFTVLFTLGCAAAAYRVHREDLLAAIVIPPLVFGALITVAAAVRASRASGSFLKQHVLEVFSALVLQAPSVLLATAAAALVALIRVVMLRRAG
jgi:hypothetical protein